MRTSSAAIHPTEAPAGVLPFDRPAERWFEALPIGNGRLGAMVYGGRSRDRLQLSESTAWSGAPAAGIDVSPTARDELPLIRELLFAGDVRQAQQRAEQHLVGRPRSFGTNVPLPEVWLELDRADRGDSGRGTGGDQFHRWLDLDTGIVEQAERLGGYVLNRETFASHPHQVIAQRITADDPAGVGVTVGLQIGSCAGSLSTDGDVLWFDGAARETVHSNGSEGVAISIGVQVLGAMPGRRSDRLQCGPRQEIIVLIAVATDWDAADPASRVTSTLAAADDAGYPALRRAHVDDHSRLMRRVSIELDESPAEAQTEPIDIRRKAVAAGADDHGLTSLYFQYGRYLTVAGSRHDSPLPLALQGIWNDGLASSGSWSNDFHLDINTQQNYWAAESTNLAECHEPLLRFVERLAEHGETTAATMYEVPGWVAHTVTNAWGYTAPGRALGWGLHVTAGAWIALHLWEHFEYNRDLSYLRTRAYPILRGAALFYLHYLTRDPVTGRLVSGPSESPENHYVGQDGGTYSISMGSTVDRVFIDAVWRVFSESARVLDLDAPLRAEIDRARPELAPFLIGRHGQLQEWLGDWVEAEPAHRHTSHLCSVYPERQISPRRTPDLAQAVKVTIERRQSAEHWEQTEWVEANFALYYARLLDGDQALRHLTSLITDASEDNLMSYSVGGVAGAIANIYSFDGNAGGTAAVAEMLVQTDGDEIELLPALPASWRTGAVRGLRGRGGVQIDLRWQHGKLCWAQLTGCGDAGRIVAVRYGDDLLAVDLHPGKPTVIIP